MPFQSNIPKGRQTEEGWSIYKEDELGMSNEGGGETPRCCSSSDAHNSQILHCVHLIVNAVCLPPSLPPSFHSDSLGF